MHQTLFFIFLDDNAYISARNSISDFLGFSMLMYAQIFQ